MVINYPPAVQFQVQKKKLNKNATIFFLTLRENKSVHKKTKNYNHETCSCVRQSCKFTKEKEDRYCRLTDY